MNRLCQNERVFIKLRKQSRYMFLQSFLKQNLQTQEHFVKPHEKIPNIKGLPWVGTLIDYLKMKKGTTQLDLFADRVKTYGSIYKERLPFFGEVLFTASPEDFETVER